MMLLDSDELCLEYVLRRRSKCKLFYGHGREIFMSVLVCFRKSKEEEELKKRAKEELKKELAKEQEEAMVETRKAKERREKIVSKMAEIEKRQAKESLKV